MGLLDQEYSNLSVKPRRSDRILSSSPLNYRGLLDAATNIPIAGDALSGLLAISDAAKGDYVGAGLNALGVLPFVSGTFIGKSAKTWDKVKEAEAMSRLAKGDDAAKVWKETGVGIAPWDKKVRGEISDHSAKVIKQTGTPLEYMQELDGAEYPIRLSAALDHPELYKAYPDLADSNARIAARVNGGAYEPSARFGESFDLPFKHNSAGEFVDAEKARSTTLHEVNHAIQERSGFAKGGSPEMFDPKEAERTRDILSWRREVEQWANKNWPGAKLDSERLMNADQRLRDEYSALGAYEMVPPVELREQALQYTLKPGSEQRMAMEQMVKDYGLDKKVTAPSAMSMYQRLPGEAEARLTQYRMNLTPEERLAQYPYDPAYFKKATGVDIDSLIIRGLLD